MEDLQKIVTEDLYKCIAVLIGVEGHLFEELIDNYKLTKGVLLDTDLDEVIGTVLLIILKK